MTEFTATCTIELETYVYLKDRVDDLENKLEEIYSRTRNLYPDFAEECRDDGLF